MYQLSLFKDYEIPDVINVSQVKQLSPFRYPGGKTWLVPRFRQWLSTLSNQPKQLIEPFAGGGIISLSSVYASLVEKCIMIEKDNEVAAVWHVIINGNWKALVERILTFNLTIETAKEVIQTPCITIEEQAFRTILKNRICHGGIIAVGSGFLKNGENGKGILSRWYPTTLARRIETIANMRERISFFEGDAFDYIEQFANNEDVIFFVDPPYTASKKNAGKRLYKHFDIEHEKLFYLLKNSVCNFMLTYDYDENVVNLSEQYRFNYEKTAMTGTHNSLRYELLITR